MESVGNPLERGFPSTTKISAWALGQSRSDGFLIGGSSHLACASIYKNYKKNVWPIEDSLKQDRVNHAVSERVDRAIDVTALT